MRLHPKHLVSHVKTHQAFMHSYSRELLIALLRPSMVFLFFTGLGVTLLFSTLFYFFEGHGQNPRVDSFFDAVYFTVSTMTTVGFGDVVPTTTAGRVVSMLMMIMGTGLFVSYTAVIAAAITTVEQSRFLQKKPLD